MKMGTSNVEEGSPKKFPNHSPPFVQTTHEVKKATTNHNEYIQKQLNSIQFHFIGPTMEEIHYAYTCNTGQKHVLYQYDLHSTCSINQKSK